jgi:transposase InsO family protein
VKAGARLIAACETAGITARTHQRWSAREGGDDQRRGPRTVPHNKLTPAERERVIEAATCPENRDLSPRQLVPKLADEGRYVASEATFYRVLKAEKLLTHRSASRPATHHRPRQLVAMRPDQVWSWDITYLCRTIVGAFFFLYMVEDLYSRKIVAWEVHERESDENSANLICRTCAALRIPPETLTLHSDNGGPMKGATMLATLQRLHVTPSRSRPSVSDDNPYIEALFRTLKYCPEFPNRPFATLEEARCWVANFVAWYNTEHRHSGVRYVTPEDRYVGRDRAILARRHDVYARARKKNPERWSGPTRNWSPVASVTLNPDKHATMQN